MKVIIPSYEPDDRLVKVVKEVREQLPQGEILVINDGSSVEYDDYFDQVSDLGAIVLSHSHNKGKGAALKTAFSYLVEHGRADDMIVTIDSDGQHLVSDMVKVANAVNVEERVIILGARAFVGQVPFRSRFGNTVTAGLFRLVTGQAITDTQTGLRAFPSQLLPWLLQLEGDRFEYEFKMLLEAKGGNVELIEVPIETVYIEENSRSHFRPIVDSIRIYTPFLKFSGIALTAAVVDMVLLLIMMLWTKNLLLSIIVARILSALTQFYLNANHVFHRTSNSFRRLARYGLLALFLLACNYVLIQSLISVGIGLVIAKIVTEVILFILSYRMQHTLVFV
ncbi:bifunctional glycosyltransferase family 2/GtrA family protein [Streptococcus ovis]|uniref:bifunctional glycosyltransferase family 2/GtrA family protein n=1 Tax=Streptococcus ovis TaxID=82806 RepID=UPI00036F7718|nr:bifunctional glycosyltransferase family 2/GtrA family protein [Streptococcus ovis]